MTASASQSTVLLVRHVHTEMAGRFCGHSDPDLSQLGKQQLQEVVRRVRKWSFTKVYSSSLIRARRTAEAVAASMCLEVNVRPGLGEINFGAWEGKSWAEIEALYPVDAFRWLNDYPAGVATDGELFTGFQRRVLAELRYLAEKARNICAVVVTHGGFIHATLASVGGIPAEHAWNLPLEYGSITELNYSQQRWGVGGINIL